MTKYIKQSAYLLTLSGIITRSKSIPCQALQEFHSDKYGCPFPPVKKKDKMKKIFPWSAIIMSDKVIIMRSKVEIIR